ncbi:MAG: ABC transporter ATP-binding protein [Thermofilaceae archaeon]
MEKLLEISGLKTYFYTDRGVVKAVDGAHLDLLKGEVVGVAGESGCGKSTLGHSIIRLVPPPGRIVGGKILYKGLDLLSLSEEEFRKIRWREISMIFQAAMNVLNPVYTVGEQIAEVFMVHNGLSKKEALEKARELLSLVGVDPRRANSYPHEMSGGMKQRVVIAMALALSPSVVVADEPTTALDVIVQAQIINLLKRLRSKLGLSMIFISHDLSLIAEIADRVAVMYAGQIVELGSSSMLYREPRHPYTRGLLESIPRLRGDLRKLTWIEGAPPDLVNPPEGCRFAPRCSYRMSICSREEPPLASIEPGYYVKCWLYA